MGLLTGAFGLTGIDFWQKATHGPGARPYFIYYLVGMLLYMIVLLVPAILLARRRDDRLEQRG